MMTPTARALAERLVRATAIVGLASLVAFSLFVLGDALSRWLIGRAFSGTTDVIAVLFPVAVASCFPAAILQRRHIVVEFVGHLLGARARRWLDRGGQAALFLVLALVAWQCSRYAGDVLRSGEYTWVLRIPLYPTWIAVAALFWLSLVVQGLLLADDMRRRSA